MRTLIHPFVRRSILATGATVLAHLTGCGAPAEPGADVAAAEATEERAPAAGASEPAEAMPAGGRRSTRGQLLGAPADDVGSVTPADLPENNPGLDGCPGELVAIGAGVTALQGTTAGMTDDSTSWCGDVDPAQDTPDVVYELDVQVAGSLSIRVAGQGGMVPAFQLRQAACATDGNYDYCIDTAQAQDTITGHFEIGTYWLVIDGSGQTSGGFDVVIGLDAPSCGDGILNPGEACDMGDAQAPNDGCDSQCQFEGPQNGAFDVCAAAEEAALGMGSSRTFGGYTTGFGDDYDGSCSAVAGGRDRVYAIFAEATGTLTATVGALDCLDPSAWSCWDRVLFVREGSCDAATDMACSDDPLDGAAPEQVSVQVTQGQTYWIFVDGYDAAAYSHGPYTLDVSLTAPANP